MKELTIQGITHNNHIECEIQATTDAYMEIVETYRTVAKLEKDHPKLKKFIPEPEPVSKPAVSKKAESIVKNFEAA